MKTASDILTFWFDSAGPKRWYQKSDVFDAQIRREFEDTAVDLAGSLARKPSHSKSPHDWEDDNESILALIIALDQFPRNMYRDTKAAFAWDALALGVARRMVGANLDLKIDQSRRAFVYMPFMHSENLDDQDRCVALADQRLNSDSTLHHAREHRKVIERFGRFPHRNKILERTSTQAELRFLEHDGYAP